MKISRKDAKIKKLTKYFTGKQCKYGHVAERWVSTMACVDCTAANASTWRANNVEHRRQYRNNYRDQHLAQEQERSRTYYNENKENLNEQKRLDLRKNPAKYMMYRMRDRSKKIGIPFDITSDDFEVPTHCPIFNEPLIVGNYNWAPSVDRVIPSLGYVKGNVIVVSAKANRIKNDATIDEIRQVLDFYSMQESQTV